MEKLREKALKECEEAAKKPRFGLFSQPPPLCVGDDSAFKKLTAQVDADGKVITGKRGIFVPTGTKNTCFGKFPKFIAPSGPPSGKTAAAPAAKDDRPPFSPAVKKWNEYQTDKGKKLGQGYESFAPSTPAAAVVHKNAEGKVTTEARGIYAQCTKVGPIARPFGAPYPVHMPANPAPAKKAASGVKDKDGNVFVSTAFPRAHFTKNRELFAVGPARIRETPAPAAKKEAAAPFRPSHPMRSGSQGFFQKIVPALDPRPAERGAAPPTKEGKREGFRPPCHGLSTPTPSVLVMNALRA